MPYKLQAVGLTDVGLVRQNNEDVLALIPDHWIYMLADGMGGHQAGEVAARETIDALCAILKNEYDPHNESLSIDKARSIVTQAIEHVNSQVYKMGRSDRELRGMGTTLCCLCFHPKGLVYAHVGDSRIYRLRDKKLTLMTKDHSLMRELLDLGELDESQAGEFVYKNIITKAVGTEPSVQPTVRHSDIHDRDVYMMCSDGLSDLLKREEMEKIMNKRASLAHVAQHLIDAAKEQGGHDNITVVLVKVTEKNETKGLPRQ